ncbi:MAG: DUF58 domain-containing protein [Thermoplasmata archaeon]|nr:DUF58 domain-containing protein [Thermoplasmata archaeon]
MITRRGWAAVAGALAAVLLATASLNPVIVAVGLALFVLVTVEIVRFHVQFRRVGVGDFAVERTRTPARLPVGSELVAGVTVRYEGRSPAWIALSDVVPEAFPITVGPPRTVAHVVPGGTISLRYAIRPALRGAFVLGPVGIAILDPLGLSRLIFRPPVSRRAATVVPAAILAPAIRPGLRLFSRTALGIDLPRRGYGTEFRSLRPYQPFDDIRHMAWKRSRPPTYYVREFEQESRQTILAVLDLSQPMSAGLWGENALDRSVEGAALLAALISRQGEDRIGLATFAGTLFQYIAPTRASELALVKLGDNLAMVAPRPGEFQFAKLLDELTKRLDTPSHVFLFSTLQGPMTNLHLSLIRFRRRGHRLYTFVPRLAGFYPDVSESAAAPALEWARGQERLRTDWVLRLTRSEGIVSLPFDRRGASGAVLRAYTAIRGGMVG